MTRQFEQLEYDSDDNQKRVKSFFSGRLFVSLTALLAIAVFTGFQVYRLIASPDVSVIGEAVRAGEYTYEVLRVETSTSIGSFPLVEEAEGVFKTVEVAVLNSSKKDIQIDQNVFTIMDAEGTEYFPVCRTDLGNCASVPATFTITRLSPGEETIGVFTFDVDPHGTGYRLRIIIEPFSGDSVYFKLD